MGVERERGRGGGKISRQSFVFLIGSNAQRRAALLSRLWGWSGSKRQALAGSVGCRGRPSSALCQEGDRVGGSNTWSEVAFTSPAFQKFRR